MNDDLIIGADILVVDDSLFMLKTIEKILHDLYALRMAASVESAVEMLIKKIPDLIILDWEMPRTNGLEFLIMLKNASSWKDIPVIFLTGSDIRENEEKALHMGAVDYIHKPILGGVLKKRIQMHLSLTGYQKRLESMVESKTKQLLKTQELIIDILANVTTFKDNDTGAHITRTTEYVKYIIKKLTVSPPPGYVMAADYADSIIKAAKMHDIGKIAIPDGILLKPTKLTPLEYEIIKTHTVYGAMMLEKSISQAEEDTGFLITARDIILHHHEWWDGSGYPYQLKGTDIPLSARIMAVADVYDALISNRPYKKAISHEEALHIIEKDAGKHIDPFLVAAMEDIFPQFEEIARQYTDSEPALI